MHLRFGPLTKLWPIPQQLRACLLPFNTIPSQLGLLIRHLQRLTPMPMVPCRTWTHRRHTTIPHPTSQVSRSLTMSLDLEIPLMLAHSLLRTYTLLLLLLPASLTMTRNLSRPRVADDGYDHHLLTCLTLGCCFPHLSFIIPTCSVFAFEFLCSIA